jgi:hypothetical protein
VFRAKRPALTGGADFGRGFFLFRPPQLAVSLPILQAGNGMKPTSAPPHPSRMLNRTLVGSGATLNKAGEMRGLDGIHYSMHR